MLNDPVSTNVNRNCAGPPMLASLRPAVLVALLLPLCASYAAAQARSDGWTYTMNITIDSGNADHRISMAIRNQVTATRYRMEMVQVSGAGRTNDAEGSYSIVNDADTTMTSVMPTQHMAIVVSLGGMFGAGAAMRPTMKSHVTTTPMEDLGPGDKILGHATRHFRYSTAGTMDITIMGHACSQRVDGTTELWVAPDVDLLPATSAAAKHFGMSAVDALGEQLQSGTKLPIKGATLRTISTNRNMDSTGHTTTVTSTMEFVELQHGPLDAALFTAPSDYKVMDMREMIKQLPAGMLDSAMKSGMGAGVNNLCNAGGGR
jgi:hypothetical protein